MNAKYNKIITDVLAPIFHCRFLPFIHVAKLFNRPTEVISIAGKGVGTPEDPIYMTAHRGVTSVAPENTIPAYEEAVRLLWSVTKSLITDTITRFNFSYF